MKVALVYDRINTWGGAERVLLALHEFFPDAPLYTSVYNKDTASWAAVFPKIHTSFLQNFPYAAAHHELYGTLMPLSFEGFTFDEYDLVISVTSEAAKGIITKPSTRHICLCLTPTRYLWSGYDDYFADKGFKSITKPIVNYLRAWDKVAGQRPDEYIAISKEVRKRIKKYYGRKSKIIYPPVLFDSRKSNIEDSALRLENRRLSKNGYFLIVSRLVPFKRVDIAVRAFNELGWKLKIIGTGSDMGRLKAVAKGNIEFLGNLTDEALSGYYEDCTALVVPGVEDFGLASLEAQSFGKPVIAVKMGGVLETVIEGKTGEFFSPQMSDGLVTVLKDFDVQKYTPQDCIKNAQRFSLHMFKKQLMEFIK